MSRRVLIMGAAGRDFHNFNVAYRDSANHEVVAFTATQVPFIARRVYPPVLAGPRYPGGIPIHPETHLDRLIADLAVDEVAFSYSDVSYQHVMHTASRVMAAGASFVLLGPRDTMITARVPVVAVCAVRTGSGKSQTARRVTQARDPHELATGTIGDIYRSYDIGPVLPAMGYRPEQLAELEQMINTADADVVVIATPVDLARLVTIGKPAVRVRYDLVEAEGSLTVPEVLKPLLGHGRDQAAQGAARAGPDGG